MGNQIALGAIKELGLRIPEDVSLISFDEQPYFELISTPLTTIKQPIDLIGQASVSALFELMNGGKPVITMLDPTIIERSSVKVLD